MIGNYMLLCLFVILPFFTYETVALEAIIRGTLVRNVKQFPYMAAVYYDEHGIYCGGSILSDHFILTARSCVPNHIVTRSHLFIIAGTLDVRDIQPPAKKIRVTRILTPPTHDFRDIAVLMLNSSLELSDNRHLKALKLPHHNERGIYETYAGKTAVITGFGWYWHSLLRSVDSSDWQLRFAEAKVLSEELKGYHKDITDCDEQICARIKQHDAQSALPRGVARQDGGGPLVYRETVIGILVRIDAQVHEEKNTSSIYTRVSNHVKFIQDAMNYAEEPYLVYALKPLI